MNLLPTKRERRDELINPFSLLRSDIDRFFSDSLKELGGASLGKWTPKLDLKETEKEYCVKLDVPGVDPAAIEVSLSGSILSLSGEKRDERESDKDNYHVVERSYGSFARSIQLPENVDIDNIRAESDNGVLTLTLPKTKGSQTKQIKINSKK